MTEAQWKCSRANCTKQSDFVLSWRNPKIHDDTRVKTWLACQEHVEFLKDYLSDRDFPVEVSER